MREIKDKLEKIVPSSQLEEVKKKSGVKKDLEWHWDGGDRDFIISEAERRECEKHECRLMYDDMNEFYYCPLCEK